MSFVLDRGAMLRDFPVTMPSGAPRLLSDFRGRRLLVLVFDGTPAADALLAGLAANPAELDYHETQVIAIAADSHGFPTAPGAPRAFYGAENNAAVFITDRYGEIFHAARAARGEALPTADEVFNWLDFINRQCPE